MACEICQRVRPLTRDHVIPRWLIKTCRYFGNSHADIANRAGVTMSKLVRDVCSDCNITRSGDIDYSNPIIRAYLKQFILSTYERIQQYERPKYPAKIVVKCMCKNGFGKVSQKKNIISSVEAHSHTHWKGICWCGYKQAPVPSPIAPLSPAQNMA